MSPEMPPSDSDRRLPEALRQPLSRNVALLLDSRIPARMAWAGPNGVPRLVPIWFHWTGAELVMTSFAGAAKLAEIASGTRVTVSIDTETFPYRGLRMGGRVVLETLDGLSAEYRLAAVRCLGPVAGEAWCRSLAGRAQVAIRLRPTWAVSSDMSGSSRRRDRGVTARPCRRRPFHAGPGSVFAQSLSTAVVTNVPTSSTE